VRYPVRWGVIWRFAQELDLRVYLTGVLCGVLLIGACAFCVLVKRVFFKGDELLVI
jgi:hypothetical protein